MRKLYLLLALFAGSVAATELTKDHPVDTDGTFVADDGNAIAFATDIACGRNDPTGIS